MTATALLTLSQSCRTAEKAVSVERPVPIAISFPKFPELGDATENDDGTVTLDGEFLVRLAEYKFRIQETEESYEKLKELYGQR